jgi:glycosyltransferase involved in cell wall biosynthesis
MTRVSVCVVTYRRPVGLSRLLRALGELRFVKAGSVAVEVLVVDNDPEGSAAETLAALGPGSRWPLRYEREPRRGIARARNAAVACARERADFIAFVDDDEAPEPAWLDELLYAESIHAADVVAGPVLPEFEEGAPGWIVAGGFFERPRYRTGTTLTHAATNNVLVRSALFAGMGQPFDERLALAGGEDTEFFLRVARAGHRIVWADEARVREWNPRSRTSVGWLLRRSYRRANTWGLCERDMESSTVRGARVVKGVTRIAQGVCLLALSVMAGRAAALRAAQCVATGAGNLAGIAGLRYQEYRTTHGR